MRIKVHYLSTMKQTAGTAEETYELPSHGTVAELLRLVVQAHGDHMRQLVYTDDGSIMLSCFRNGASLTAQSVLADGDVVEAVLMLSGG